MVGLPTTRAEEGIDSDEAEANAIGERTGDARSADTALLGVVLPVMVMVLVVGMVVGVVTKTC
jgi:hypothetical protein